ncbi:MAG: transglycosylase SLT domain-containing protein [Gemmatimonadota bacterium]
MMMIDARLEMERSPGPSLGEKLRAIGRRPPTLTGFAARAALLTLAVAATAWYVVQADARIGDLRIALGSAEADRAALSGENALLSVQLERLRSIQEYSARYDIPSDLAAAIYDIALGDGLEPDLAFRLVETESSFRQRAVSSAGAIGYTQILPSTARWLDPTVTEADLFERDTNLRLGFQYLNLLLGLHGQDMRLTLLAYNRGPNRVRGLLALGQDPANGYARSVMGAGE